MTKEQFQLYKQLAVAEQVTNTARALIDCAKIAYPRKWAFSYKDKKQIRRKRTEKLSAKLRLYLIPHIGAVRLAEIIAQPPPKYENTLQIND